ncbi:porin family protein [Candidatus Pelagibacter sp.]|nr:porin family protein [Candidatus Pelagibacter sp.]
MKKILTLTASFVMVASSVFAGSTNIGLSVTNAKLSASGTETVNSAGSGGGGAASAIAEKDGSATLASIFVERQFETQKDGLSISLGLDFIPMTGEIAKLDGGNGTDAKVEAGKLLTLYVQPTFLINDKVSLYAKAGYAQGDLDITEVTRQATTAGTASTDTDQSKDLKGTVLGFGAQIAMNNDMFIRFDASRTDFDTINHTNSNTKKLTADAEMDRVSFVIGKSF